MQWAEENDIITPVLLDKKIDRVLNGLKSKECSQKTWALLWIASFKHTCSITLKCVSSHCLVHVFTGGNTSKWFQPFFISYVLKERAIGHHLTSFAAMLPWFAAYDHMNYTRWGAVYLQDMNQLSRTHPDVYKEFCEGIFAVKKRNQTFNKLSLISIGNVKWQEA